MPSFWQRLWRTPPPTLACEFLPDAVAVARWSVGAAFPERIAVRPLPPNALRPSPVRENLAQPKDVSLAVASALEEVAAGGRRRGREIALLLPDLSARLSVLQFDDLPATPEEILPLLKFRLKKSVPFDVEEAAISYQLDGTEALVALAPQAVVRQYESIFEDLGYYPGLVTLSTLAGLGLVEPSGVAEGSGIMLLRDGGGLLTIAVCQRGRLRMIRSSELAAEGQSDTAPTVEEVFRDVYASALYFQDTYGAQIERVLVTGLGEEAGPLASMMEAELGVKPRPLVVPARAPEHARFVGLFGMIAQQARQL